MKARGASAVMASRVEPPDALDDYPTPPFATRALCEIVLRALVHGSLAHHHGSPLAGARVWEPAANRGLMAEVLREYAGTVLASDVFDYGVGYPVQDFLGTDPAISTPDWIVTNPPFRTAEAFARRALAMAAAGVALFVRWQWLESEARYRLFEESPPDLVALFSERVCLTRGRWEPDGSTATAYCWVVWRRPPSTAARSAVPTFPLMLIPPGQKRALTRADDARRFAPPAAAPLFDQPATGEASG